MKNQVSSISLDAFRGLLALIVCFAHSWQILIEPQFGPYHWDHAILGLGARYAVDAFYVLSGWVIFRSVDSNIKQNASFNCCDWALNRGVRILPPLLVSVVLTMVLWGLIRLTNIDESVTPFGLARFKFSYRFHEVVLGLVTLGFFGDLTGGMNGPLWSLAYEIQLYVIVLLAFWISNKRKLLLALLLFAAMANAVYDSNALLAYGSFGFGFTASWASSCFSIRVPLCRALRWCGLVLFLSAVFVMGGQYANDTSYLDRLAGIDSICMQLVFSLGFAVFLSGAPKFEVPGLISAGGYSYTLYIIHFPILLFFSYAIYKYSHHMQSTVSAWSIWMVLATLVVFAAYLIAIRVEQPKRQKAWVLGRYGPMCAQSV